LYPVPWAISPYDHFFFVRPIAADQINWPVADYRYGGVFFGRNIVHTGVDIPSPEGTPIMAAGPGTVTWTGWGLFRETPGDDTDPYGLAVAIRHDFGYNDQQLYTIYAHMSEMNVIVGQRVETGEVIGLVGSTGATTGPHVHFEVRLSGNSFFYTYNPELWIAPPQGWGVLAARVMDTKGRVINSFEVTVQSEQTKRTFAARTYGDGGAINPDAYYNENLVLADLPAGIYKISFRYEDKIRQTWVEVFPGQVTYFTFTGEKGFSTDRPPVPTLEFLPQPLSPTLTPLP
jgi:murein DD-endopeptidase MepM/ murein hydrolase activator NlpD